jgi:hypothetical protein
MKLILTENFLKIATDYSIAPNFGHGMNLSNQVGFFRAKKKPPTPKKKIYQLGIEIDDVDEMKPS